MDRRGAAGNGAGWVLPCLRALRPEYLFDEGRNSAPRQDGLSKPFSALLLIRKRVSGPYRASREYRRASRGNA